MGYYGGEQRQTIRVDALTVKQSGLVEASGAEQDVIDYLSGRPGKVLRNIGKIPLACRNFRVWYDGQQEDPPVSSYDKYVGYGEFIAELQRLTANAPALSVDDIDEIAEAVTERVMQGVRAELARIGAAMQRRG